MRDRVGRLTKTLWVAAVLFGGGAACAEETLPVPDENGLGDLGADHVGLTVSTDIREEGALRARVYGDTVYTWEDSARMLLFPVKVDLFDKNGALTGHLTADKGELDTDTQLMFAAGSVVVVNVDSTRKVLTQELHYDPRSDRVWSDIETTLIDGASTLHGTAFKATADLREIEMFGTIGESTSGQV